MSAVVPLMGDDGGESFDDGGHGAGCAVDEGCHSGRVLSLPSSVVRNEVFVLGDVLLRPTHKRPFVDFQTHAIESGLRYLGEVSSAVGDVRRKLVRTLVMFDTGPGGWDDYLDSSVDLSRRRQKSPRLSDLDPTLAVPVISVFRPYVARSDLGLSCDRVIAVAEQKLRHLFLHAISGRDGFILEKLIADGFVESELQSDGEGNVCNRVVARCRGVSAGLFMYASRSLKDSEISDGFLGSRDIDVVRVFMQADKNSNTRVSRGVVVDGAKFAQLELGVTAKVVVYFYTPVTESGGYVESIVEVVGGCADVMK